MDENNMMNNENEELNEKQEMVEETETVEATEENFEEVYDDNQDVVDAYEEVLEGEEAEEIVEPKEVNYKLLAIIGFALAAILLIFNILSSVNVYNHKGYLNTTGYTIGDIAKGSGKNFFMFKREYGLPLFMGKDTYANAAKYMIRAGKIAEINGTDFETLKNAYGFGDKITKRTPWGKALDSLKLSDYLKIEMSEYEGDAGLETFKKEYELGDEVTGDTLWGDVRPIIEKKLQKETFEPIAKAYVGIKGYNKYNNMGYLDTTGGTIADVVAASGMSLSEFLKMYGLPADMGEDTYLNAAQSLIPIKSMAELNNMDIEELKEMYKFGDEVTGDSTWGEAIESMTLRDYVGEANFETFKTEYELGDEITLDTKWGEIRKQIEEKQVAERLEQEEAAKAAQKESEAIAEENAETTEEAPEAETAETAE